jgi:truncated hemoglobin YjbI
MNTALMPRKRAARKPRQSVPSKADRELEAMQSAVADILSSKEKSAAFLQRVGIIDKHGRLTKPYRA